VCESALDCAKAGQEVYGKDQTAFLSTVDVDKLREKGYEAFGGFLKTPFTPVDLTTRNGWPGWDEIKRLLE
jgi:hypothetical protein